MHAIEHAAGQFRDTAAYRSAVLHGHVTFPEIKPSPLTTADFLYGAAGTLGALLVAWLGLFGYRLDPLADQATQPLRTLRHLHSGHVGDYVTWLTVKLAAIGGVCALSLA